MDSGDQAGEGSPRPGGGEAEGSATPAAGSSGADAPPDPVAHPGQSPLYHAHHADRYQRQQLIKEYQQQTGARLVSAIDVIDFDFVQNIEEHLLKEDGSNELHVLLRSPGGDGEQAVRAIRAMQARCSKLVFVVPDMAKSAATLMALGADEIRVGPASDLGPIDPQMQIGDRWFSAKAIVNAVQEAQKAVAENRELTPLWASLLAEVTALDYQAAQLEMARTKTMIEQALGYRTEPPAGREIEALVQRLVEELQDSPTSHASTMGPQELQAMGLPVVAMDPCGWEWECIWRLWIFYWVQIGGPIYESAFGSFRPTGPQPA